MGFSVLYQKKEVVRILNSGASHVELTMGKDRIIQFEPNNLQRLPLGLVDRHGKAQSHGELDPLKWDGHIGI